MTLQVESLITAQKPRETGIIGGRQSLRPHAMSGRIQPDILAVVQRCAHRCLGIPGHIDSEMTMSETDSQLMEETFYANRNSRGLQRDA